MGETLLQELCSMLDSYAGRDKVKKIVPQYSIKKIFMIKKSSLKILKLNEFYSIKNVSMIIKVFL